MISKTINDIATDSMKIKGIKGNIVNRSSSVVSYSSWLNNMRLIKIGTQSIYKFLGRFMNFKV